MTTLNMELQRLKALLKHRDKTIKMYCSIFSGNKIDLKQDPQYNSLLCERDDTLEDIDEIWGTIEAGYTKNNKRI